MGCLNSTYESFMKRYKAKQTEEKNHFNSMKNGLQNSIENINGTLKPVKDWEDLLSLNSEEEFYDEKKGENPEEYSILKKSKTVAYIQPKTPCCYLTCLSCIKKFNSSKFCSIICFTCGFLFCLIQLIGVQEGIIILNALFDEIFDGFKLSSKEYNFYEKIEIATYKSIPEIDVGMFWSFIGTIVLKKYGFKISSIFHIISSVGLLLLFVLFDFHTGDKLLIHYTNLEYTVLVFSYIGLSISIGASSTLALKQLFNLYKKFYQIFYDFNIIFNKLSICFNKYIKFCLNIHGTKSENDSNKDEEEYKEEGGSIDEESNEKKDKYIEQIFFFNFSTISAALIIVINREIFKSLGNMTTKWIFWSILIVYFASFILSLPFYGIFSIPLTYRKIQNKFVKEKKEKEKESEKNKMDTKNKKVTKKKIMSENDNDEISFNGKLRIINTEKDELKDKLSNKNENKSIRNKTVEI